jgi:hypothetical protein
VSQVRLGEVRNFLNLEQAVLGKGLDEQGALAGLFDSDINTSREARLEVLLPTVSGRDAVLGMLGEAASTALVHGLVALIIQLIKSIQILMLAQVLKIRNSECKANSTKEPNVSAWTLITMGRERIVIEEILTPHH